MPAPKLNVHQRAAIDVQVDDIFDSLLARLLGHGFTGKKLFIGINHDHTIPSLFGNAINEEGGRVDTDILGNILEVAEGYLDKYRNEAKAATKRKIQGILQDIHVGRTAPEDFRSSVEGELADLWGKVKTGVQTVVASETQLATTLGTKTAVDQIAGALGVETIYCFVPVRDHQCCEECLRIHLLPDGVTPRVFKAHEISNDYHKKGEDSPSFHELHPHGRCCLSTILPGFGFDGNGRVTWIDSNHREWDYQHSSDESGVEARRDFNKSEQPLEKGLKQSQIMSAMRAFGWQDKQGGGHDMLEHPTIGAKIPFQRGYAGDYDWNWVDKHLSSAGLMRTRQNKIAADPKHPYYPQYVASGHAQPTSEEPKMKTWDAPESQTKLPIDVIEMGDVPGGKERIEAMLAMRAGKSLPHVDVMDMGNGTYGSLNNHHLVQAARDVGMTHIPVTVRAP